ncbi:hypothetical protein TSUD_174150 [Trifolium subterraneum]|nr:hypothetical protein TSUD_174150 [Trifolium subterraneum]
MNTELLMPQRGRKYNPLPSAILPDDLIIEILSLLKVKSLMKMKCVSKSWKTLISDPKFVKMNLNQSSRNSHFYAVSYKNSKQKVDYSFLPFSINDLLDNRLINLPIDPYYRLIDKDCYKVVGSCNGLICLLSYSLTKDGNKETWCRLWNPATRTISGKLGYFRDDMYQLELCKYKFMFCYDTSTDTYKVVTLHPGNNSTTEVRVLSFGDNIWRNIQSFNARPLQFFFPKNYGPHGGVHLNCTVNWLANIKEGDDFAYRELVIISLDVTTETHTQLLPPQVSLEDSLLQQGVCVLMSSLCFCHVIKGTDFVIWMMTEFGDNKSWTQF